MRQKKEKKKKKNYMDAGVCETNYPLSGATLDRTPTPPDLNVELGLVGECPQKRKQCSFLRNVDRHGLQH